MRSIIGVDSGGAPSPIVVANGAGLGTPALGLNPAGDLVITNPNYATTPVLCRITAKPTGGRREFFRK